MTDPEGPVPHDDGRVQPLALVETIGRILFARRPGDPRHGMTLAFEHLGEAADLMAIASARFERRGDITITGMWVAGGVLVDVVGNVVPAAELPDHGSLRTNREPMVFSSDEFGPTYGALLDNLGPATSLLGVPVVEGDHVVGALVVVGRPDRVWDDELVVALSIISHRIWGFLARCRIENDFRERAVAAELLADIAGYLNTGGAGVSRSTLELVTASIADFTGATAITHHSFTAGDATPFLHWRRETGFPPVVPDPSPIPVDEELTTRLAEERVVRIVAGDDHPASVLLPPGTSGMVSASFVGLDLVGAVVLESDPTSPFTDAHVDLVGGVVDLFGQFRARMRTERALARRRRIEGVRAEIAATFVASDVTDVDDVIVGALARLGGMFGSERVNWLDIDPERGVGRLAICWRCDCDGPCLEGAEFPIEPALRELREPHVMAVENMAVTASSTSRRPNLVIPTAIGDRVVGALTLEVDGPGVELPDEELEALVDVGRLVHQVRGRAADARRSRRREELDDLQLALASRFLDAGAADPADNVDWAMARIGAVLGADVVSLIDHHHDGERTVTSWTSGPEADRILALVDRGGDPFREFWEEFLRVGEPMVRSSATDPESFPEPVGEAAGGDVSLMAAPSRGTVGALALTATTLRSRAWTSEEVAALRHMAGQFRQFLDAQAAHQQVLRHLALDGLVTAASARLVETDDPDRETTSTVEVVGEFFDARSVAWVDVDHTDRRFLASHVWQAASVIEPAAPFRPIGLSDDTWDDIWPFMLNPFVVHGADLGAELRDATPESVDMVHIVVPVVVRGRPVALLVIQTDDDLRWSETELSALTSLATVVHEVLDRDRADRLFSTTFRSAPTGQLLVASTGAILAANTSFIEMVGADPVGSPLASFFDGVAVPADLVTGETRLEGGDDRPWVRIRTAEVGLASEAEQVTVVHLEDVTAERRNREQLRWDATHDDLTGLENRRVMMDALDTALSDRTPCAVLMIDVDRFKVVNDSLGHTAGDRVLVRIAERLRLSVRADDLVCRFGGDEFGVLVVGEVSELELAATAQRLIDMLRLPVDVDGTAVIPTCSVGIAVAREDDDLEAVMRHADAALYEAKTLGRDRYEFFDDAHRDLLQDRLRLETDIRHALLERRFVTWFQPEHDIRTGAVMAVEALVRWDHVERGLVAAGEFIDVAEDMGLAPQLSRLVLDRSLAALRRWRDEGVHTRVRVNVAGGQLQSADFHQEIGAALDRSGLAAEQLCIEITERALMLDLQTAVTTLEHVRAMGVEVAVDDFGTGFSSLARLKDLPVDTLKIDRSFVSGIVDSGTDREIVRTIIGLGRGLGLDVVAEGVESAAQAELLLDLGCRRGQGWFWSRAMSEDDVPAFLATPIDVR